MKILLPFTCLLLLFSSCSTYQYMTISSTTAAKPDDFQDLVIENDSFLVRYNFNGPNAPVNLLIQNKLDQPVYIYWKRSGIIINDQATSYVPNIVPIQGTVSTETVNWSKRSSSSLGNFYAEATLPNHMDFLPPKSFTTKSALVSSMNFTYLPDSVYTRIPYKIIDASYRKVNKASFTPDNSPVQFRSYITIITGDSLARPVFYQHYFYISEIINTGMGPENFQFMANRQGDHFYTIQNAAGN